MLKKTVRPLWEVIFATPTNTRPILLLRSAMPKGATQALGGR